MFGNILNKNYIVNNGKYGSFNPLKLNPAGAWGSLSSSEIIATTGDYSGTQLETRALNFSTGITVDFTDYTIGLANIYVKIVCQINNSAGNQVLLKSNHVSNLGLFKRRSGLDNRLSLNFLGTELLSSHVPSEGWHVIEWYYNVTTFTHRVLLDGVEGTFLTSSLVPTSGVLNINGGAITQISTSGNTFLGLMSELYISNYLHYKFTEATGRTIYDSLNNNHGTITGTATWTLSRPKPWGTLPYREINYANEEGYSVGRNLFALSNTLNSWVASGMASVSLSTDELFLLVPNTTNTTHRVVRSLAVVSGQTLIISVYAKAREYSFFYIQDGGAGAPNTMATFGISNNSSSLGARWSNMTRSDEGNGVYRYSVRYTAITTQTIEFLFGIALDLATPSFAGNGTSGLLIGKVQAELGTFNTPYQPTFTSNNVGVIIPRKDNTVLDALGNPLDFIGQVKPNLRLVKSNCVSFNGTSSFGIVENPIDLKQSFSLGCFINFTNQANRGGIFFRNPTSFNGVNIGLSSSSGVDCRVSDGTNSAIVSIPTQLGTLAFYGITWNASTKTLRAYNSSGLVGSQTNININTTNLDNGAQYRLMSRSNGEFVAGQMAMFFQAQSVLTDQQMLALANRQNVSNVEIYPLAEGGGAVSYQAENPNKSISWTSTTWGLQDVYHYNINNGFSMGAGGLELPYMINGVYSNPAQPVHNGAETLAILPTYRESLANIDVLYNQTTMASNEFNPSLLPKNSNNELFTKYKDNTTTTRLVEALYTYDPALTGTNLAKMNKYVGL